MNNQEFLKRLATFDVDILVTYRVCLGCFSTDNKGLYILPEPIMDASVIYCGKVFEETFPAIPCPYGTIYKIKARKKAKDSINKYK